MTFYVGQKVVCLTDDWYGEPDLPLYLLDYLKAVPVKGQAYHVRSVKCTDDGLYIRLFELVNPMPPEPKDEVEFNAKYFSPIEEQKTDIAIFTEILDRANGNKPRVKEVEHQS